MKSRLYGVLGDVEVLPPNANLTQVHNAYIAMAAAGVATQEHQEVFISAGRALRDQGCEAVLLGGTDLALVFKNGDTPSFETFDCAQIHAETIAQAAMRHR